MYLQITILYKTKDWTTILPFSLHQDIVTDKPWIVSVFMMEAVFLLVVLLPVAFGSVGKFLCQFHDQNLRVKLYWEAELLRVTCVKSESRITLADVTRVKSKSPKLWVPDLSPTTLYTVLLRLFRHHVGGVPVNTFVFMKLA